MYSQQELDDAVASGVISARCRRRVARSHRRPALDADSRRRAIPAASPASTIFSSSIAAAILLFAVGWIGQCDRPVDRAAHQRSRRRRAELPRAAAGCRDGLGRWRCSSPPSGGWPFPRSCCCSLSSAACFATAGFLLVQIIGPDRFNRQRQSSPASLAASARPIAAGAAWLALAPVPCADHRRRWRRRGRRLFLAIVVASSQPRRQRERART